MTDLLFQWQLVKNDRTFSETSWQEISVNLAWC